MAHQRSIVRLQPQTRPLELHVPARSAAGDWWLGRRLAWHEDRRQAVLEDPAGARLRSAGSDRPDDRRDDHSAQCDSDLRDRAAEPGGRAKPLAVAIAVAE